jgi:radical SAM family uncharacterized protein/radical SAM-linked protein
MIDHFSRAELLKVERPSRYLGGEVNSVVKDISKVKLRFAICFPDIYEVGMSHYGLLLLYDILNSVEEFACERAFLPWTDMIALMRKKGVPLWTLETGSDVRSFDIVGISVSTELAATSVVELLELAGIEPLSERREEPFPLILGGGAAMFNPEPFASFFDAILIGDGEEAVLDIAHLVADAKKRRLSKTQLLDELSTIEGVYIPSFFKPIYENGKFCGVKPLKKGYEKVRRRWLKDINKSHIPSHPIIPLTEIVHDRLTSEISRGCVVGCRFCQAGYVYRPVREKQTDGLYKEIMNSLDNSGFEEVSLLSLSSGDYTGLESLCRALFDRFGQERISLSLPSLRASGSYNAVLDIMSHLRKSGITVAPEVATERLRRFVNKPINESELLEIVREVSALGWRSIKLYFMVGLPTETDEDIDSIAGLIEQVVNTGRKSGQLRQVNVSISPFVPKPHTPLQWERFAGIDEIERKVEGLARKLRRLRVVNLKLHSPQLAQIEALLSRGDRRFAEVILEAHKNGALLDSWNDLFKYNVWLNVFKQSGLDYEERLKEISTDAPLPWDHISIGVGKEFLINERERAYAGEMTPICRYESCNGCGVCGIDAGERYPSAFLSDESFAIRPMRSHPPRHSGIVFRYRVFCTKTQEASFLGHLEMKRILERAFRRARMPLKFSEGNTPEPRISFGQPVPLEVESSSEIFDVEFYERMDPKEMTERVNPFLPRGIVLYQARPISPKDPSIGEQLVGVKYKVELSPLLQKMSLARIEELVRDFMSKKDVPFVKERKGKERLINLREFVEKVELQEGAKLQLDVRVINGMQVRAKFILSAIFGLNEDEVLQLRIRKVQNILADSYTRNRRCNT